MHMKCSSCGSENQAGAKFCKRCGASLEGAAPKLGGTDKAGKTNSTPSPADGTHKASAADSEPKTAASGVAKSSGTNLLAKLGALSTKTKAIAGGVAAAVVVIVVAVVLVMNGGPSDQQFEQDIRSSDIVKYSGGAYGTDGTLNIDSIKVTDKKKQQIPAQWAQFLGVSGDAWEYAAEVKLSNDTVEKSATVTADYVKSQGKWQAVSSPSADTPTYTAKKGPDEDKILESVDNLLSQAKNPSATNATSPSLSTLYKDADFTVTGDNVNGNTATVTIHGKKENKISTLEGDLTAAFKLDSAGTWTFDSVSASDNMGNPSLDKLMGTWTGTFDHQTANGLYKCLGSKERGAKITFTSYDPQTKKLEGTFSGMAHYHDSPSSTENSDSGDTYLESQPFTITLKNDWYNFGGLSGNLGGAYSQDKNDKGQVQIELIVGDSKGDDTVEAIIRTRPTVSSNHLYTVEFGDMYSFAKDK